MRCLHIKKLSNQMFKTVKFATFISRCFLLRLIKDKLDKLIAFIKV